MDKSLKRLLLLLLMFSLFTAVFFFGMRVVLNAVHDIKLTSLFSSTTSSSTSDSSAAPIALGDNEQPHESAAEQRSIKWEYLTYSSILNSKQIFGIAFVLAMLCTFRWLRYYDMTHGLEDLKGEERWQKKRELKKNYVRIKPGEISKATAVGTPVAHFYGTYYVRPDCAHNLIIGTTGSGKTQTHVLHSIKLIAESADKQNFLINDPKGEILSDTYSILAEQGYKIVVLNLRDTNNSSCWNPLSFVVNEYCRCMKENSDLSLVSEYVSSICEVLTHNDVADRIWSSSSRALLSAMILLMIEKAYDHDERYSSEIENGTEAALLPKVTFYSVFHLFSHFGGENAQRVLPDRTYNINALDELFKTLPLTSLASAAYSTSRFAEGEMRSSIFATTSDDFQIFSFDRGIARLTSRSDIDFDAMLSDAEQPFCIYMIIPDDRPSRHIIASMFINQAYMSVMEHLQRNNIKTLPRRLNMILDEFANLPKISGMDNKITVSRSRNVQWWLYIQDLAQLETAYDKQYKTIRENCANTIYIYSGNTDTNEHISKMLGDSTRQYRTVSGRASEELSEQQQYDGKSLKTPNQLRRLKYGETIVIPHRQYPILSTFSFFYKLNIPKTSIDCVFAADDTSFTADTNLMPLYIFSEQLPPEFAELKNRLSGDVPGGGGRERVLEQNPMDDHAGDPEAAEAAFDEYFSKIFDIENDRRSEEQIIDDVNALSHGELKAALDEGNLVRATAIVRQLGARSLLDQEQSVVIDNYLRSLRAQEQELKNARK